MAVLSALGAQMLTQPSSTWKPKSMYPFRKAKFTRKKSNRCSKNNFKKVKEIVNSKYSISVPKYFTDYKNLTQEDKEILESENTSEEYVDPNSIFVWDCNWYLSEQNTIHNIKCLYDVLELKGYDEQSTRSYYRSWIKKLEELI